MADDVVGDKVPSSGIKMGCPHLALSVSTVLLSVIQYGVKHDHMIISTVTWQTKYFKILGCSNTQLQLDNILIQ